MKNESMVAMDRDAELLRTALFRSMASAERRHSRELLRKNARQLGVFEAFRMRLRGYADGQHGTPRETPEHNWTSPLLQREIDAQQEHRERGHSWPPKQCIRGEHLRHVDADCSGPLLRSCI